MLSQLLRNPDLIEDRESISVCSIKYLFRVLLAQSSLLFKGDTLVIAIESRNGHFRLMSI